MRLGLLFSSIRPPLCSLTNNIKCPKRSDRFTKIRDHEGRATRRPIPQEKLDEWIKSGRAKRVFRVLIKGLAFDGSVVEEFWELSEEDRMRFVADDDTAHVLCHFENGEPQFFFVAKKLWVHLDEVSAIMENPTYTKEQKLNKVRRFIE